MREQLSSETVVASAFGAWGPEPSPRFETNPLGRTARQASISKPSVTHRPSTLLARIRITSRGLETGFDARGFLCERSALLGVDVLAPAVRREVDGRATTARHSRGLPLVRGKHPGYAGRHGRRRAPAADSNAWANRISFLSSHAPPKNERPIGSPSTYPAGTVTCGYPATAGADEQPLIP